MLKEKNTNLKELCEKVCFKITQDDKIISSSPYEFCVFCGKETNVRKDSYIDYQTAKQIVMGWLTELTFTM